MKRDVVALTAWLFTGQKQCQFLKIFENKFDVKVFSKRQ